jgi:hypothetical protein
MSFKDEIGAYRVGSFSTAQSESKRSRLMSRLPQNTPVLKAQLDANDATALLSQANTEGALNCGLIFAPQGPLLTILLQRGTFQSYWVADMSDPEVWAALDAWHKAKLAPFVFVMPENSDMDRYVGTCRFSIGPELRRARKQLSHQPSNMVWQNVCAVAASGILERQATTDLPNFPVEHVIVNALKTQRASKFEAELLKSATPTANQSAGQTLH